MAATFALTRPLNYGFDEALERLPPALAGEGFGVLTQIDVTSVFAQKLGQSFRRYRILGACNPTLAHRALSSTLLTGVMLPCNVVLWENDDGTSTVAAVDPTLNPAATAEPAIGELAGEVKARLTRVLDGLVPRSAP
jgi:uncharacterized protein (DUF302 family)